MTVEWEIKLTCDGVWPTPWRWTVWRLQSDPIDYTHRGGYAMTKDRARKRALAARRSMETEDVSVTW